MTPHDDAHGQSGFDVRLDWGLRGAECVAPGADRAVVVDVLSFTTTLSVAADRGIAVLPYPWRDAGAAELARDADAALAVPRSRSGLGDVSLSPGSVRRVRDVERLVLPSPNGSTLAHRLAAEAGAVVGACLRNADAVGRALAAAGGTVALVAAGERWPDGSLRPAVEDLWGVGAVADVLAREGRALSPEAQAAVDAYRGVRGEELDALLACASGRELAAGGWEEDVRIAAEVGSSATVPVLVGGRFVDRAGGPLGR
ncbi:2-phosphosulfolactate phosphatase [Actinotalea sp. AC32]|nr:2-phosphosulfolactate phosphatase [Actinotalea sp. AC32]